MSGALNLQFAGERIRQVREVVRTKSEALLTLDEQYGAIYRQHPFYDSPDFVQALRALLESPGFGRATDLP